MRETMNVIKEIKKLKLDPDNVPNYAEHNKQVDTIIEYLQEQFFILDGFLRPLTGETIPKEY
jgi:hypothetical protein